MELPCARREQPPHHASDHNQGQPTTGRHEARTAPTRNRDRRTLGHWQARARDQEEASEFAEDTARDIWLFPAEIAHLDPWDWVDRFGYWTFHHERQPSDDRPFRFDHVPAGTWVLCAGNRRTRMEVQQVVEVPKGEPGEHRLIALGDVGPMDRRAEISADLAYTIDHVPVAGRSSLAIRRVLPNGLRLYTTSAETPERLFEYRPRIGPFTLEHFTAGHRLRGDGTARLRLAPGRYEAEIFSYTASIHSTLIWSGIRTRFTVAADGTTTPAKLRF